MSVLIVEDDSRLRNFLKIVVRRCGLPCTSVDAGDVALQMMREQEFSAVILDLMLPGMTGFQVLESLRNTHPHLLRRIIILTAVSQAMLDRNFDTQSLVWSIIRKPFDVNELTRAIDDCTRFHTAQWPSRQEISKWLRQRVKSAGARAAVIAASDDALKLQVVVAHGFPSRLLKKTFPLALSGGYPLSVAARTGRAVWLASISGEVEYPLLSLWTAGHGKAIAAIPLRLRGVVSGAIGWSFPKAQRFDHKQRAHLLEAATECVAMLPATQSGYLQIS